jgi:hypothetical protein
VSPVLSPTSLTLELLPHGIQRFIIIRAQMVVCFVVDLLNQVLGSLDGTPDRLSHLFVVFIVVIFFLVYFRLLFILDLIIVSRLATRAT